MTDKDKQILKRIKTALKGIIADYGYTAEGWLHADAYLQKHGVDDYFMGAIGVGKGSDVERWMYDYYVGDQNEGPAMAKHIADQLSGIDEDGVYLSNQGLDPYNRGEFMPTDVEKADSGTIQDALGQMIKSLHDFPERYVQSAE